MTDFLPNHRGPLGDDPDSPSMTVELTADPGLVDLILSADLRVAAGEYDTLDELRDALKARRCTEDSQ